MPDFVSSNNAPGLPQRWQDMGDGTYAPVGVSADGPPPSAEPSLDFSDSDNSQYAIGLFALGFGVN